MVPIKHTESEKIVTGLSISLNLTTLVVVMGLSLHCKLKYDNYLKTFHIEIVKTLSLHTHIFDQNFTIAIFLAATLSHYNFVVNGSDILIVTSTM